MFGIRNLSARLVRHIERDYSHLPHVLEGADVLDTLCPVSAETGQRENALSLLNKVLDPRHQYLADSILQTIPSINDPQGISDDDALDMIVSRFDQGSQYDNQLLRDNLAKTLDVLLPGRENAVREGTIKFDKEDDPDGGKK